MGLQSPSVAVGLLSIGARWSMPKASAFVVLSDSFRRTRRLRASGHRGENGRDSSRAAAMSIPGTILSRPEQDDAVGLCACIVSTSLR